MFLRKNPFIRLLIAFIIGILIQWYLQLPFIVDAIVLLISAFAYLLITQLRKFKKIQYAPLQGFCLSVCIIAAGAMLTYIKDVRNLNNNIDKKYKQELTLAATLLEPLVEKQKSYKAELQLSYIIIKNKKQKVSGKAIAYFKKDSINQLLKAGDEILFAKSLQQIQNAKNPGGFDYKRYSLFNGITHQVYLTDQDYKKLSNNNISRAKQLLLNARSFVLNAIKSNIKGKKEQGLAEAMLIGYKDDLDKNLLQSYTNTGVVHVIAVSGMHLALLYWILNFLLTPLLKRKITKWMHPVFILLVLWSFSFLAGGAASIVRAAVMFSFITIGTLLNKNASVYNILAASAFCQLCYNPYWLWDVGFQLSYVAVLSIVGFYKPIYNLLFIKNKLLDWIWRLAAVSIAAQILTTPVSMYYFNQFPVYFLLSNLIVVPVSTVVLIGTLLLVILSPIKLLATFIGSLLNGLIWWLNTFIERMEQFPFALWEGIEINFIQTILLFVIIIGISFWLMEKMKTGVGIALIALVLFFSIRTYSFYKSEKQQKIIVYNANKYAAIEFISGREYLFIGNEEIFKDQSTNNFVLKPSHVLQRLKPTKNINGFLRNGNTFLFRYKKIVLINNSIDKNIDGEKLNADLVILSGNPKLYISELYNKINAKQIVIDASAPAWKAKYWKKDCDALKIPCHNVATDGAFVMNLH